MLKRILYRIVRKLAGISFNILNVVLVGNLPPLGSICVVVEDRGRYLLLQRPEGSLVFPGGIMDGAKARIAGKTGWSGGWV